MKLFSKYLTVALTGLAMAGCNDLDTEILGNYATTDQKASVIEEDSEKLVYSVTGVMGVMNQYMGIYSSAHCDFGFPSVMLCLDSRGTDLVGLNIGYNWFSSQGEMSDGDTNNYTNNFCYRYPYKQIFAVNTLLETVGSESTDPQTMYFIAQARAVRAFDYWVLAQLFQFTYNGHASEPCVPIITEKNSAEVTEAGGAPRATVEQVYAQILDDLNVAIAYLRESEYTEDNKVRANTLVSSKPKRLVSLATALGLRARTYLVMNRWAEAAADAKEAINEFIGAPISRTEAASPCMGSLTDNNWMWGIAISEQDRVVTSGIVNWPSHMGSFGGNTYAAAGAWRMIAKDLFDWIPATDVRRGWWLDADKKSANLPKAWQDFCNENSMPAYTQVKFAPYQNILGNTMSAQDIPLMRVEEMYLIQAEAEAMSGAPTVGAKTLTDFVKTYRDRGYSCTLTDPAAIQEAVWMQRRIELWGEGMSYYDLMRLKKGIDRRGGGWCEEWTYNIPAESNIMRLCLPQGEIETNKLITPADNNPSAPMPTPVLQ
ncbi:MAG: RagB/SusD family nutrient uptake outer membrane protein [Candidatus Amulumruptor caecigallinarius]|nr:RagB/SusD family nutrient uptake outer membrane protein [Candidatus Amulumruptor caecigallinarius]MCM1397817.1 RagB/SusD family nutrient uptake outer membrane protein [Candidatus Amulumruptor caecigallinarius]MCM1454877.1 RagB/SusD family nutrient uptake outer membrane protein [bacterium]